MDLCGYKEFEQEKCIIYQKIIHKSLLCSDWKKYIIYEMCSRSKELSLYQNMNYTESEGMPFIHQNQNNA